MPTPEAEVAPFLAGVILAAGAATRMARTKQLLPLAGRSLLQRVLDAAVDSRLDEVILVLGHRAEEIRAAIRLPPGRSVRVVVNADFARGQSSSLRLGVRSANPRAAAVAVLLADQPGVTAQLIDRVASAFLAGASPVARPVYCGPGGRRVPGHPVFLARRIWTEVEELHGDEGARALLRSRPDWLLEVPVGGAAPGDVDTLEDYQRALREEPDPAPRR